MKRSLLALSIIACGDTTTTTPDSLNLDRPIDIAFACYGGLRLTNGGAASADQDIIQSAQPIQSCDIRSQTHADGTPNPLPPGQETLSPTSTTGLAAYYGFILQSEPGTVALAQWDTKPTSLFAGGDVVVLDADPLTPGKNGITVGEDPVAIVTDKVGCYELTANRGSCDMSALEINSALDYAVDNAGALANHEQVRVDRIEITSSTGKPVRAKAATMVGEPQAGTIGVSCPAQPTGLVYVAYPNCHLVAGIDSATGMIVTGVQFDSNGVPTITNGDVTCNDECGGGGAIGAGPRPIALDLEESSDRRVLAIGSENSNVVTIVELDLDNRPTSTSNVVLQQNKTNDLGVTSISISPAIGMGGSAGFINDDSALGGEAQFIYAVATDHTVRVANIDGALNKECDTQVDPRYLHSVKNVKTLSCMFAGDPATPPRRPGAKGPGIELIGDAIPTSVDVFKIDAVDGDTRLPGTPTRMIGYFGVITAANGAVYMLNVDNDDYADFVDDGAPIGTEIPLDIAHQLRDALPNRGAVADETTADNTSVPICDTDGPDPDSAGGNSAGTRSVGDPTRTIPSNVIANEKLGELPSLRQVLCVGADETKPVSELSFAAPVAVRDTVYPDLRGERGDETLTMTWEGSLSTDSTDTAVDGPAVRESQLFVDASGMYLEDQTQPYCDAGVEPYDTVQLRGCDPSLGDADCPLGYTCFVHPNSLVTGLGACMLVDEADRLANACKEFLTSLRRYTVGTTAAGTLQLLPRKRVLRTTPIDGCTDDTQCQALANYALQNFSSANPMSDTTAADTHHWSCQLDTQRKPELDAAGMPMKRCIETCQADADCDAGTVCSNGTCMEGVVPPQACVNAPQRYELRSSEAFTVIGSRSGYAHSIIADANGNCIKDPNANPLQVGRIPLRAAACDPTADPFTGKISDGHCSVTVATVCDFDYQCPMTETCVGAKFDPNPCETTVDQSELAPNFSPGTCNLAAPPSMLVTRQADAIRFRNRGLTLTLVDPTYPGDAACIGDRGGNLGKVPIVPPLYESAIRITAGFQPLLINVQPAYPVKVTRGPGQSIWVIDEGDYLSTSISLPSTRGKVYRIESQSIGAINLLQ
jgi:hypothetical protein